ncbi:MULTISPECIES: glycosyltransferase family 4 protein [Phyllobacteriaceae]|uniref:glycosyltransferase family 4 protein n=1 Tax=Phyllobacteriaceae TaxID=69277 RepID=UPI0010F75009|nr:MULTISPECIES: glycosyltransferase family 4 protein [Mesorhizobium]MBN9235474.1 glycosyltransferase family 4 protein [Mesorhizobium sp.]MDQ0331373.1 UDP-glucose:(heptosyl)LPS alpha-1,3-glucosyltransferase [Mesorhizobium sp. YL-MeA3-2017]
MIGRRKMRIAFVVCRFGKQFGGREAYVENIVSELKDEYDIHIFCQKWESELSVDHTILPCFTGISNWINIVIFTYCCKRLISDFDIIHTHENIWIGDLHTVHSMPIRFMRFHHIRQFWRQLGTYISPRFLTYLAMETGRYRGRKGKLVVAVSPLTQSQIELAYPSCPPISLVPPGVNMPSREHNRQDVRRSLNLPLDRRYILLIANRPMAKGLETILRALRLLCPSTHLIIVGGFAGTRQKVFAAARSAGVLGRIHYWPACREVSVFYLAADICVFLTHNDAFGMVPLEAMAFGCPVIISPPSYCGFTHFLKNEENAIVVADPSNEEEAAGAIARLLNDPELYETLSSNGKILASQMSWSSAAEKYSEIYRLTARRSIH